MNQTNPTIWVIGAGKFGRISVDALRRRYANSPITVVDNEPAQLAHMTGIDVTAVLADGVDFLLRRLVSPASADWVIPVIPLHVAAEWVRLRLESAGAKPIPVPDSVAVELPNPMRGGRGEIYTSLADFICPDNCPQPVDRCTRTGEPRPCNLYDAVGAIRLTGYRSVVVVSHQLAPGVGALSPEDLFRALHQVAERPTPCLLATACRCHGVVSAISFGPVDNRQAPGL